MSKKIENFRPLFFDKTREEEELERAKTRFREKQIRRIKYRNAFKAMLELIGRFIGALIITITASIIVSAIFNAVNNDISLSSAFQNILDKILDFLKII